MRDHLPLYRDPMSPTGVALSPGPGRVEIAGVDGLPEHRVEVHSFRSNDCAIAFVLGVGVAGGNRVACHREAESDLGKCVVVAHLTEDRPADAATVEEAVRHVAHRPSGEEARVIARSLDESLARRRRQRDEEEARMRPAAEALAAAGFDVGDGVHLRPACGAVDPLGWGRVVDVRPADGADGADGLWVVGDSVFGCNGAFVGGEGASFRPGDPVDPRVVGTLAAHGAVLDPRTLEFSFPPVPPSGLADAVRRMGALWGDLTALASVLRQERGEAARIEKRRQQRERAKLARKEREASRRTGAGGGRIPRRGA